MPARGRQRDRPRQSDPPPPAPRAPPTAPPKRGWHTDRPPPPHQTNPPAANHAAFGARGCQTAPAKHAAKGDAQRHVAGRRGGLGWHLQTTHPQPPGNRARGPEGGGGEPRRDRPPPLPPPPPLAHGMLEAFQAGAGPIPPLPGQGRSPSSPQEGRGTRGGAPLGPYATRPHTATRPLPR